MPARWRPFDLGRTARCTFLSHRRSLHADAHLPSRLHDVPVRLAHRRLRLRGRFESDDERLGALGLRRVRGRHGAGRGEGGGGCEAGVSVLSVPVDQQARVGRASAPGGWGERGQGSGWRVVHEGRGTQLTVRRGRP